MGFALPARSCYCEYDGFRMIHGVVSNPLHLLQINKFESLYFFDKKDRWSELLVQFLKLTGNRRIYPVLGIPLRCHFEFMFGGPLKDCLEAEQCNYLMIRPSNLH